MWEMKIVAKFCDCERDVDDDDNEDHDCGMVYFHVYRCAVYVSVGF